MCASRCSGRTGLPTSSGCPARHCDRLDARADQLIGDVGLDRCSDTRPPRDLSYGRKRVLEIATTLALDPEVLLLDEPMAGMGRRTSPRISIADPRRSPRERTVLMVEHNLSVVADICRPCHRAPARRDPRRRRLCQRSARDRRRARGLYGNRACLDGSRCSTIRGPQRLVRRKPCRCTASISTSREGETVTLLGRNGVGKTTTLRAIIGIIRNAQGQRSPSPART